MDDKRGYEGEPAGSASLAVLERQATSPAGRRTVWFSAVTLMLAMGAGGWLLLRGFEAARHRPPSGLLDLFGWIIGS